MSIYDIIKAECKELGIRVSIVLDVQAPMRVIFDSRFDLNLYNISGSFIIKNGMVDSKKKRIL